MNSSLTEHIEALERLRKLISEDTPERSALIREASLYNPWYAEEHIRFAISAIAENLREEPLRQWLERYAPLPPPGKPSFDVGLILAGNIPLVGFHDILCVLLSGHRAVLKLSSQDQRLSPWLLEKLREASPSYAGQLLVRERLGNLDAVIATGSNNSSRYFDYYFGKYPHIIRKNRNGVAVLSGNEEPEQLKALGKDIFLYFGLGCRNVSKLFVPENYDFAPLLEALESYREVASHHKYANNYAYQLSIQLMNRIPHYNNGFLLLQENRAYASPIATLYYEHYQDAASLALRLEADAPLIQCTLSADGSFPGSIPFGESQAPALWDYADGVDTMDFLLGLYQGAGAADSGNGKPARGL